MPPPYPSSCGKPKKIACPASAPNLHAAAAAGQKLPPQSFMAPRDAKPVHPARRLAPGTRVCVRTRLTTMVTDKCCLVVWLPARVVSAPDAYHCTVRYSVQLSPAYAGKMVRKPLDHVRVVKATTAPEKKDRCFL